jgi:hypothetical protein
VQARELIASQQLTPVAFFPRHEVAQRSLDLDLLPREKHATGLGESVSGVGITRLNPGKSLTAGQFLISPNRRAQLIMQPDGNLVLYDLTNHNALWGTLTNGKGGTRADMQPDGNFVLYTSNFHPLWASGTDVAARSSNDRM